MELGYCYYVGKGPASWRCLNNPLDKDINKAKEYFEESAKKGNPVGMVYLSIMCNAYQIKGGSKEALAQLNKAIKAGYPDAYAYLGDMKLKHSELLWTGKPTYYGRIEGIEDLMKGSELGSALASYKIGYYNLLSRCIPVDFYTAALYYEKAQECGLTDDMIRMFSLNEIRTSIGGGHAFALVSGSTATLTLVDMYSQGLGVEKNYFKAIKAAEQHIVADTTHTLFYRAPAYLLLERCYYNGLGVKQNYDKALYCYLRYNGTSKLVQPYLTSYYRKGALNANRYESYEDWIDNLPDEVFAYNYTSAIPEEPQTLSLTYGLFAKRENGVYHIFDETGQQVSAHCYDSLYIERDSVVGYYNGYRSCIKSDGTEAQPILLQMLAKAEDSEKEWKKYYLEAIALDGDGTQGIAGIVYNNWGAAIEESFHASNIKGNSFWGKKKAKIANEWNNKQNIDVVNSWALLFYEKAFEKDPGLIIAEDNAIRIKSNLKIEPKTSALEIALSGAQSFLQTWNNVLQIRNERKQLRNGSSTGSRKGAGNSPGGKKSTTTGQAQNQTRESSNYYGYEQQLKDMHDGFLNYSDATRKQWQASMKRIREKLNSEGWHISKSQWEDWNGKK